MIVAEPPAPLQCQTEAARFASTSDHLAELHRQLRRRAVVDAIRLLVAGDRAAALAVMDDALRAQAPLTYRPARLVAA